ncbi:MAG: Uncharacterized protein Athens071416_266 [Parcubacteria group bacterium Athens0714_16]|nr:MAG: Uncharacterized protein Athens071416_266 [Parcubacteria group bacterium Athens0714_16]
MKNLSVKNHAIKLRKKGFSYSFIINETDVSKSTLSCWLSKIPFKPNKETVERIGRGKLKTAMIKTSQKMQMIEKTKKIAKEDITNISERDLFMLGLGLYIGEGSKSANIVRVINSDPDIIKLAIKWFEKTCGIDKNNFSITIHLYPDNDIEKCLNYWSGVTGIRRSNFNKTYIDTRKDKKVFKKGKLPHGTAHLTVISNGKKELGVFLFRKINAWTNEAFKKINNKRD